LARFCLFGPPEPFSTGGVCVSESCETGWWSGLDSNFRDPLFATAIFFPAVEFRHSCGVAETFSRANEPSEIVEAPAKIARRIPES
jgi:hypothetical protein